MQRDIKNREITPSDVLVLAERIIKHLSFNPGDFAGAAVSVGISRDSLLNMMNNYPELFNYIEDQFYDKLHSLCRLDAMGQELPDEFVAFDFQKAKTLLTWRQRELIELKKVKRKEVEVIDVTEMDATEAIKSHLAKLKLITVTGEGDEERDEIDQGAAGAIIGAVKYPEDDGDD